MTEDEPLFTLAADPLRIGDHVRVQTIWGDEHGVVEKLTLGEPYPMAHVRLETSHDYISINLARVHKEEA